MKRQTCYAVIVSLALITTAVATAANFLDDPSPSTATSPSEIAQVDSGFFAGLEIPPAEGPHEWDIEVYGENRHLIIDIPSTPLASGNYALMLVLHPGSRRAAGWYENKADLQVLAENQGVVLVFPEGGEDPGPGRGRGWNAWDAWGEHSLDDVTFLAELIAWIQNSLPIEPGHVWVTGHSNGAAMTQRFTAERPELVSASVAVCHSTQYTIEDEHGELRTYTIPTPVEPSPILLIRGGNDNAVPSDGTPSEESGKAYHTPEEQLAFWVSGAQCDPTDVVEDEPASGARRWMYNSCGESEGAVVHMIFSPDLGHTWASALDEPILEFLFRRGP